MRFVFKDTLLLLNARRRAARHVRPDLADYGPSSGRNQQMRQLCHSAGMLSNGGSGTELPNGAAVSGEGRLDFKNSCSRVTLSPLVCVRGGVAICVGIGFGTISRV